MAAVGCGFCSPMCPTNLRGFPWTCQPNKSTRHQNMYVSSVTPVSVFKATCSFKQLVERVCSRGSWSRWTCQGLHSVKRTFFLFRTYLWCILIKIFKWFDNRWKVCFSTEQHFISKSLYLDDFYYYYVLYIFIAIAKYLFIF